MRKNRIKLSALGLIEAIFLIWLFLFALFLEMKFAVSLLWQFNVGMVFVAFLVVLPCFLLRQYKIALGLFLTFNVALLSLYFLVLTPVKPFSQFQRDITVGMTTGEVQTLLLHYFPENGKFRQPARSEDASSLYYQLDPTDGRYDAEVVAVYLKDGRVVSSKYLPD